MVTSDAKKGVIAAISACLIWGFAAIFYRQLAHVPPFEVMLHRMLWSLVFFGLVLASQRRLSKVRDLLIDRGQISKVVLASLVISANWFLFIYAIHIDKLSESSLGYYISPLISVLIGLAIFRERMSQMKWAAVGLAALAVTVLTFGLGAAPWISLVLGFTFASYSAIKKTMQADSVVSVFAEVVLMSPMILLGFLMYSEMPWELNTTFFLLVFSGPLTAGPLMLFSYAAARIRLTSLGILSYINPTLQFLVAWLIFGEHLTRWHAIAFPLIWVALVLYSGASFAKERRQSTSSTTEETA